jgi:hypothetical protein
MSWGVSNEAVTVSAAISLLGRISLDPSVRHGFSPLASLPRAAAQLIALPSIAPAAPRAFSKPLLWGGARRPAPPRNNPQPIVNTNIFRFKRSNPKQKLNSQRSEINMTNN